MKINEKIAKGAIFCLIVLFFASCSGLIVGGKSASLNLVFNSDARTAFQRAVTDAASAWTKAEFTITENSTVSQITLTNTGSSPLYLTHTARIGSTLQISVVIFQMVSGRETAVYSGASEPVTVAGGTNNIIIKGIFKEDTFPLITLSYTVMTQGDDSSYDGIGVHVFWDGKRYFSDQADFTEDQAGRIITFTFRAPVGEQLLISTFLFTEKEFNNIWTRAVDFFGTDDSEPYTVRPFDNTILLIPDDSDILESISLKLNLNNVATLSLSALRSDVVYIPYEQPENSKNGYVFCFRPKDFETLETLGLMERMFTRTSGSGPIKLRGAGSYSGDWPFTSNFLDGSFSDSDMFELFINISVP